ncbi:MAG TPA: M13-type metalloendopeptidase, partial [Vicinamibacterales bacterium]|nr:M13-type metalloendopeptidase [Vicinamibacterales bacterium]
MHLGRSAAVVVLSAALASSFAAQQPAPTSGLDPGRFDRTVRPQDDLFRHVNGGWLATTEIPAEFPVYGSFVELSEKVEADLYALIEELAGTPDKRPGSTAQQVGDLFASFVDQTRLDQLGAAPLRPRLQAIDRLADAAGFASLAGRLSRLGLPGPVGAFVNADAGDPNRVILYLFQAGTALPDRDYYLEDTPQFRAVRQRYVEYLTRVFTLVGRPAAEADARAVLALETALAGIQWTQVESRDAIKTYNKMTFAALADRAPGFDWRAWADAQGLPDTEIVVAQPSFFEGFAKLVPETPIATWRAWLAAQLITVRAPLLAEDFDAAEFEMFDRTLSGQQVRRQRWKRGVQLVNSTMGEALGQLYVERHFPPSAKARMDAMIGHLIEAYRQSITELDWMTPETRKQALAKLAAFSPKIAYPPKWRDYSTLRVEAGDLVGSVERASEFEHDFQVRKLSRPPDRDEWLMTPQTINAYYNAVKNEIVFPAAILQPPFFNVEADDAVNYGAIGAVIGHEIGHGFDDQGRRFDGDGRLRDWWTPADEAEFEKRAALLVEQFSAYSPAPGLTVNGELTLGENIGDLGGLAIAHRAWTIALGGRPSPVIDGLTGDQRFFMGWAQAWRLKARDEYLRRQVLADPHAPAEFRANGPLGNIPAFYEAFGVTPGDRLYR